MKKILLLLPLIIIPLLITAQTKLVYVKLNNSFDDLIKVDTCKIERDPLKLAEKKADAKARKVLQTARLMALEEKAIIIGSCWTYINEVFKRAGYSEDRHHVYKSRKKGPYADINLIKEGDWLYYINHAFHNIDHSGIFVRWVDKAKKIALILSYTGRNKRKPGRYKEYKIDNVFFITRAGSICED